MSARTRWLVFGAALLLLTAGFVTLLTFGGDDTPDESGADVAVPESADVTPEDRAADLAADASGVPGTPTSLTGTTPTTTSTTARRRAASVNDTPAPPAAPIPSDPDDGLTEEQRRYLEETKEIVETNEADLREAAALILQALIDRDEAALGGYLADDEGPQPDYIAYLAERYPSIVATSPGQTVNIFSSDGATIYFAYAIVRWEDAGLTSEHTISIPMRYVDGQWFLTSIDESGELTFVQAVQL